LQDSLSGIGRIQQAQDGLENGQQRITSIVELTETVVDLVQKEVFKIEQKADTSADLLGKELKKSWGK
jgi:hypothetical protein